VMSIILFHGAFCCPRFAISFNAKFYHFRAWGFMEWIWFTCLLFVFVLTFLTLDFFISYI
jgi:hypothetical protein